MRPFSNAGYVNRVLVLKPEPWLQDEYSNLVEESKLISSKDVSLGDTFFSIFITEVDKLEPLKCELGVQAVGFHTDTHSRLVLKRSVEGSTFYKLEDTEGIQLSLSCDRSIAEDFVHKLRLFLNLIK